MAKWLQVRNNSSPEDFSKPAELLIYDEIGKNWWDDSGVGAKEFAAALDAIPREREILVRLHSPGGSVFDGLAIYHQLQARRDRVRVRVEGLAASIASVIAMAGKEMEMPKSAFLMVHNPMTIAIGDASEMRKTAEDLDYIRGSLVSIYHAKTGLPIAEIEAAMDAETWMTGEDAQKLGYCDRCRDEAALVASANFDLSKFRNVAATVRSRSNAIDSRTAPDNGKAPKKDPPEQMNSQTEALSLIDRLKNIFGADKTFDTTDPAAEVGELKATVVRQEQEISNLKAAAAEHATRNTQQAERIAELDKDLKAAQATIADPKGKIEELASIKAREIAAGQGAPALKAEPAANPAEAAAKARRSDLKGRDLVVAAFEADLQRKMAAN